MEKMLSLENDLKGRVPVNIVQSVTFDFFSSVCFVSTK